MQAWYVKLYCNCMVPRLNPTVHSSTQVGRQDEIQTNKMKDPILLWEAEIDGQVTHLQSNGAIY